MRRRARRRPSGRPTATFAALLGVVLTLNLVGLVMVLSASSVTSQAEYGSPWHYVARQAVWSVIGAVVLLGVQRVDYHRWRRWAGVGVLGVSILLVLVLVPGVGVTANGSTRWLGWGSVAIQPSELVKLAMVVFVADLLGRRIHRMRDPAATLNPVLVITTLMVTLIMLQPNLGTTLVVVAIVVVLLFVAGAPLSRLAILASVGAALATVAALAVPYRRARVFAYLDPWADPTNTGYQTLQAWAALAEGGISGVGVGAGRAKWGFLPFAHTDFIFAVIGEEFGLLGAVAVVLLFVALGVLGVRTALRAPDALGMLLATGVTAWFVVQAFINIGAVVGVLPVTGVPLPFVSAGGSSLVASMAAAGLLANVARQASETPPGRPGRSSAEPSPQPPAGGGPGPPPGPGGPRGSRSTRGARSAGPPDPRRAGRPAGGGPGGNPTPPVPVGAAPAARAGAAARVGPAARAGPSASTAPSARAAPAAPSAPSDRSAPSASSPPSARAAPPAPSPTSDRSAPSANAARAAPSGSGGGSPTIR